MARDSINAVAREAESSKNSDHQNESNRQGISSKPVFGATNSLNAPKASHVHSKPSDSDKVFLKPKANRTEHHRPHPPPTYRRPASTSKNKPDSGSFNHFANTFSGNGESWPSSRPLAGPSVPQPQTGPSLLEMVNGEWRVRLPPDEARPAIRATPFPTFSSLPAKKPVSSQFMDLTRDSFADDLAVAGAGPRLNHEDMYTRIDPAQAFENIKALLDGAMEDENDKPRKLRLKRKKAKEKKREQAREEELEDILKGLSIKGSKNGASNQDQAENDEDDEEDDGTIEGLGVKLLPHQIEGVAWMLDRETGPPKTAKGIKPKGGILADDMGLGKTIQALSILLQNPRSELENQLKDSSRLDKIGKGTLIVAPLALLKQWESEISDKITLRPPMRVCIHHGPARTKRATDLERYDVVITTYQILASEFAAGSEDAAGCCFRVHWYRVILDEAHTIKNRNTKAAKACYALKSEYRWCLTGTPVQNNLDELQSLIGFLRIKPYCSLSEWKRDIITPMREERGQIAMRRLQIIMQAFMKRRTKDILRENNSLNRPDKKSDESGPPKEKFKVVERKVIEVPLEFEPTERQFYDRFSAQVDQSLENMIRTETGLNQNHGKNSYLKALVLLLRLRQICNHPGLVVGKWNGSGYTLEGPKPARKKKKEVKKPKSNQDPADADDLADLFDDLKVEEEKKCTMCLQTINRDRKSGRSSLCEKCEDNVIDLGRGQDGQTNEPESLIEKEKGPSRKGRKVILDSDDEEETEEDERSTQSKAQVPQRQGRKMILDSEDEEDEQDEDEGEGEWLVGEEKRPKQRLGKAGGREDEDAEGGGEWLQSEDEEDEIEGSRLSQDISKDSSELGSDDDSALMPHCESSFLDDSDDEIHSINRKPPSSKITYLVSLLRRESPKAKFIVFSEFTSMLDLIEGFLQAAGLVFTRYDGKMGPDARERSLDRLRNDERTRILLCSLRCGALGLNLTAASRVVIMEPFWNPFVEEQAIDRVHRINQTQDVIVYKLTITDSVEERILRLQEEKRNLVKEAIEGKQVNKLGMAELLSIFAPDGGAGGLTSGGGGARWGGQAIQHWRTATENGGLDSTASLLHPPTPPTKNKSSGKTAGREDGVYGRRW